MIEDVQAAVPLGFLLSFMIGPVFFVLLVWCYQKTNSGPNSGPLSYVARTALL